MADDYKPCSVRDGAFVEPCSTLARSVGKAVDHMQYLNFSTGKPSRSFFVLKSGEHRDKGIVMNHCPFCGTQIDTPVRDEKDEAA